MVGCDDFDIGRPVKFFNSNYPLDAFFGVAPDGQRFILLKELEQENESENRQQPLLVLVDNWFEEPGRMAPADSQ